MLIPKIKENEIFILLRYKILSLWIFDEIFMFNLKKKPIEVYNHHFIVLSGLHFITVQGYSVLKDKAGS